jgi:hypothetical protein
MRRKPPQRFGKRQSRDEKLGNRPTSHRGSRDTRRHWRHAGTNRAGPRRGVPATAEDLSAGTPERSEPQKSGRAAGHAIGVLGAQQAGHQSWLCQPCATGDPKRRARGDQPADAGRHHNPDPVGKHASAGDDLARLQVVQWLTAQLRQAPSSGRIQRRTDAAPLRLSQHSTRVRSIEGGCALWLRPCHAAQNRVRSGACRCSAKF